MKSHASSHMNPLNMTVKLNSSVLKEVTSEHVANVDLFDELEVALMESSQVSNL